MSRINNPTTITTDTSLMPKPARISENFAFEEMRALYDSISDDLSAVSDAVPGSPEYPAHEAADVAYNAALYALEAVIDTHCAYEVFKAVRRITQGQEPPTRRA